MPSDNLIIRIKGNKINDSKKTNKLRTRFMQKVVYVSNLSDVCFQVITSRNLAENQDR